jgi:hypothetical protein
VSPDYDARRTLESTRKQSEAARPSIAEKRDSEVSLDYDTTQHARAHNKQSAVEKGDSSDCDAAQHAHATKRERERLQKLSEGLVLNEHSEQARALHTNGARDVPRCGALSLLQIAATIYTTGREVSRTGTTGWALQNWRGV